MDKATEALAAAIGGAISAGLLHPLHVIKTALQAQRRCSNDKNSQASNASIVQITKSIIKQKGWNGLLYGMEYSVLEAAIEKAAYFLGYRCLQDVFLWTFPERQRMASELAIGYLSDISHLPFTLPIQLILAKLITSPKKLNAIQILQEILSTKGWQGLYQGVSAYIVLSLRPSIQYTVFNQCKAYIIKSQSCPTLTVLEAFLIGAIARAIATIAIFPFIRAKVLAMTDETDGKENTSIIANLVNVAKNEGFYNLYKGMSPELTRGVLSAAIMLMIKEKVSALMTHRSLK